ncbi:MAG TPA: YhbY family RNA-binding protein, partial [Clostridia bacterium]|nr:YhbY family RNA-binding protein [Clostridia bacterium]
TPREAADILAEATNSEVIQVIGSRIVLFRRNPEKGKYDEYIN